MHIQKIDSYKTSFKRIKLTQAEEKLVSNMLNELSSKKSVSSIDNIKMDIFEFFDSFFQKELLKFSKLYTHKDDFLQGIYLRFFELLDTAQGKALSLIEFMENINKIIKPDKNERKERELSLDKTIKEDTKKTFGDFLTSDSLPVYISQRSDEERKEFEYEIKNIKKDIELTEKEEKIFELKKQGKSFIEISEIMKKSYTTIRFTFLSLIAKIQKQKDILPVEYENCAEMLKQKYNFGLSKGKIIENLVKNPVIVNYINKDGCEIIEQKAKILGLNCVDYIKATFKQPQLIYQKPERLKDNITQLAIGLGTSEQNIITAAKKMPSIFYAVPDRIIQNFQEIKDIFNVNNKIFLELALKNPNLLVQKSEKIKKNISEIVDYFKIEESKLLKIILKQPSMAYQSPDTVKKNISSLANLLGVDKEIVLMAAIRQPNLFIQKPETIKENIQELAEVLNIEEGKALKMALLAPSLFVMKSETIKKNLLNTSRELDITFEDYLKSALKNPSLLYANPKTIKHNIEKTAKALKIDKKEYVEAAFKQKFLFGLRPESVKNNVKTNAKILKISEQEYIEGALKRPAFFCLKSENVSTKNNRYKFYNKISGVQLDNFVTILRYSSNEFFERSLNYFVRKVVGYNKYSRENLAVAIKQNSDKTFTFDLPKDECTEEFIQYVKDFFAKNIGTENYKFIIDGKAIK